MPRAPTPPQDASEPKNRTTTAGMSGHSGSSALPDPAVLKDDTAATTDRAKTIDAVLTCLGQCSFPATPDEMAKCAGDTPVPLGPTEHPFRDVVTLLPPERYENAAEVKEALVEHWPMLDALRRRG